MRVYARGGDVSEWWCDGVSPGTLVCHYRQLLSLFHHGITFISSKMNELLLNLSFHPYVFHDDNGKLGKSFSEK